MTTYPVIAPTFPAPLLSVYAARTAYFAIVSVVASSENRVRVQFSHKPYFSRLLDTGDASNPKLYSVVPDITTTGADGTVARVVNVVDVELTPEEDVGTSYGFFIDIITDRPLTPWPAYYSITFGKILADSLFLGGEPAQLAYMLSPSATYVSTSLDNSYIQPAVGAIVSMQVGSTLAFVNGDLIEVPGAGLYSISNIYFPPNFWNATLLTPYVPPTTLVNPPKTITKSITYSALTAISFPSIHEELATNELTLSLGKDISNPMSFGATDALSATALGTFTYDDSGDLAFDTGFASLKKRILRRLFTRRGAFAHLPTYGIGIQQYAGKLRTISNQQRLIADIEQQIGEEPEVVAVKVKLLDIAGHPEMLNIKILVKTKAGDERFVAVPLAA